MYEYEYVSVASKEHYSDMDNGCYSLITCAVHTHKYSKQTASMVAVKKMWKKEWIEWTTEKSWQNVHVGIA